MTNLQQCIENIPGSRLALLNEMHSYTYSDIRAIKQSNIKTVEKLQGSTVVINGRERLEFALLLSILDSFVEKILFLPQDIDADLHGEFYKKANVNFEVFLDSNILKYREIKSHEGGKTKTEYSTEWIIPTSGTTNIPKLVSHSFVSLTKSTKQNISIGEDFNWGLVFDIYRFSGIQVLLQSMVSGSTLIITDPSQTMSQMLTLLSHKQCNALSATPSFWRKVLMTKESSDLELKRITLGGEISDQNILHALKQKYPMAKLSHIYASTEVGVGFSVTDGKEGFPKEYLNGTLDGIKMKICENNLLWISPSEKGQKYLSTEKMYDDKGYINTGDIVQLTEDRIFFLGRDSGAINVGGNKVQPEEVETKLLSTGLLNAAYVYAIKNPMMGSLVCADVVLKDHNIDHKSAKKQIIDFCRDHLEGFKVPAIIKFVDELTTTQSGKLKR